MHNVIVAPKVRDLPRLAVALSAWLRSRLPEAKDIRLENLAYPFGAGNPMRRSCSTRTGPCAAGSTLRAASCVSSPEGITSFRMICSNNSTD